ncbi:MAG: hypothetical protein V4671_31010 [Armatimonadota bacterium]
MTRRWFAFFGVLPVIGLAVHGAMYLRSAQEDLRGLQSQHQIYRRTLLSDALAVSRQSVIDAVAAKAKGNLGSEPSFGPSFSTSEGPRPSGAFQLPTGLWWPPNTKEMRAESWTVTGTVMVPLKDRPGKPVTLPFKTILRWDLMNRVWQPSLVAVNPNAATVWPEKSGVSFE